MSAAGAAVAPASPYRPVDFNGREDDPGTLSADAADPLLTGRKLDLEEQRLPTNSPHLNEVIAQSVLPNDLQASYGGLLRPPRTNR